MPQIRLSSSREQTPAQTSRLDGVREGIQQLFTGRSKIVTRTHSPKSPKTPRPALGLQHLPSTRLVIPHLSRTTTSVTTRPSTSTSSQHAHDLESAPTITQNARQTELPFTSPARSGHHRPGRRFVAVDPSEQALAKMADAGRRRRGRRDRHAERKCAHKMKNRKIRSKVLSCIISGMFLLVILTIYLALALSNRNESQEFHVLLILIILITTIFFCHSLIRLYMMIAKPPGEPERQPQRMPAMAGSGGYAVPPVPVPVRLARDEEAVGVEGETTKFPPPAYGLWRESVRVDPNRIFWQRNESALQRQGSVSERPQTANRPPPYISDDGIDYVLEAEGRPIARTTDVPLPVHPSERGRVMHLE